MQSSIRTPGSIWARLIQETSENAKKPDGRSDGVVYFVGPRSSGKSTLLNRFLYPTRIEPPKPSEGLEYTYARKPAAFDHERKDMAHIYEIGGSKEFGEEIARGDQVFLTAKQVTTAVVVIVVDLSDISSVLPTALYWLDQVKQKLTSTYEKFEKKGLQLPEQMRQRAKTKLYSSNDDKDAVYHSGISIVIVATKYDMFKDKDPEEKKMICRALRYVAHAHGAFLVSLGGLHTSSEGAGTDAPMERALLDNFTRLMNHLIFIGLEKKPTLKMTPAMDHLSPLMVPAGTDKFRDIGRPQGGMTDTSNVAAGTLEWRDSCTKMFAPKKEEKSKGPMVIDERYKEEEVDVVRVRKLAELATLRKEAEAYKEATKRKAVLAKAQAAERGTSASKPSSSSSGPEKSSREKKSSSSTVEKRSSAVGEKKSSSAAEPPAAATGVDGGAPLPPKVKKSVPKPKVAPTVLPSEEGIAA